MIKFIVALVVVLGILVGGLMRLLRSRRDPMGSPEVLERARQREREIEARERRENRE